MQLFCEFQDIYSQHQSNLASLTYLYISHLQHMPNRKSNVSQIPDLYRDQKQPIFDDLDHQGSFQSIELNADRKIELGPNL